MGYHYDELLQKTVGAIKKELGLMSGINHRRLLKTIVSFILMIIIGLAVSILSILLVPLTIFFTLYIRLKSG
jgi:ABC-type multidrug transport system fused ATPase/permease subunit